MIKANTDSITHPICAGEPCAVLQYADDTLIVLKGDLQGIRTLKVLLDQFASMTGLHINYAKSTVVLIHMAEKASAISFSSSSSLALNSEKSFIITPDGIS